MTINATAPILLALYVAAAERQGVPRDRIAGTTQNDILKEYIARGTWIYPPRPSMRLVTDIFEFCADGAAALEHDLDQRLPHARGGRDGGPGAGVHARRRDRLRARRPSSAGSRSTTSRPACRSSSPPGRELFEEVAKFRAARRMWARIMRDRFGATNARSMACRFHVQTAGSSLTAQSIDNNVVRTTVQALAAVLGGAQSLHTNARDEALALPTEETRPPRPADPADPRLRERRHRDARPARRLVLRRVAHDAARGGRPGLPRRDRRDGRHARRDRGRLPAAPDPGVRLPRPAAIERGDRVVVGVNKYRDDAAAAAPPTLQRIDPEGERRQIERVRRVRAERDPAAWEAALAPARGRGARRGEPAAARSSRPSRPTRRSARSATGCGPPGASTAS